MLFIVSVFLYSKPSLRIQKTNKCITINEKECKYCNNNKIIFYGFQSPLDININFKRTTS